MDDRQLLEAAARAAGYDNATYQDMSGWGEVRYGLSFAMWVPELDSYWNPLTDDGDAFSLSCALGISLEFGNDKVEASGGGSWAKVRYTDRPDGSYTDDERRAAARRAIVRAAASRAKGV